jgi:hypothetical protein
MPIIEIDGVGRVELGDEFKRLSPEQQNATVQEIAATASSTGSISIRPSGRQPGSPDRERARQEAIDSGTMMDAIPRALSSGMLGNLPDYVPAVASGIGGAISGEGFSPAYDRSLEEQRGYREGIEEKYPITGIAGNIAGALIPGVAAAKLVSAPTLAGRMVQSAGVGAGLGAFGGAASGEGVDDRMRGAGFGAMIGGVLGAAGEGVISGGAKVSRGLFGGEKIPAAGVNPAARISGADEFAIPLTRGQATGNVTQQAFEQAARNDARGPVAGRVLRQFDDRQKAAILAAKDDIASGLGGTPSSAVDAGEAIARGIKNRASDLRMGSSIAYDSAASKGASVASSEVSNLGKSVLDALESRGIVLDGYGNYPGAQAAMNLLRRVSGFEGAPQNGKIVAQSLEGLEQARKGILGVKAANAEDARALKAIRGAYDDWMDNAIDNALFSGDKTALSDLKTARALWARYKNITAGKASPADKLVSKIATEDRTGEEVAAWLLNASNAGQSGLAARSAAKISSILGRKSPEFEALRQAAWVKMVNPTRGEGNQAVSTSIKNFVDGNGAALSRTLFSAKELGQMRRFASVLKSTIPDARATNRGQSGYEILRSIGGPGQLVAAGGGIAATWQTGDPRYMAIAALPLLRSASSASKAAAAIRAEPSRAAEVVLRSQRGALAAGELLSDRAMNRTGINR